MQWLAKKSGAVIVHIGGLTATLGLVWVLLSALGDAELDLNGLALFASGCAIVALGSVSFLLAETTERLASLEDDASDIKEYVYRIGKEVCETSE
jgi:hypothetical protein